MVKYVIRSLPTAVGPTRNTSIPAHPDTTLESSFWKAVVSYAPLHVKASTLTVCGLLCNITATVITTVYAPNLTEALPRWVCIMNAVSILYVLPRFPFVIALIVMVDSLYQTFDGIDGKQAQRTQDSELEEYTDHAVDSISITLNAIILAASMQLGAQSFWLPLNIGLALTAFYAAHWAAHQTHCLVFGRFDVSEAQWSMIAIHVVTAVKGPALWSTPILAGVEFTIGNLVSILSAAMLLFGIIANLSIALGWQETPLEKNGIRIPRLPLSLEPLFSYGLIMTGFLLLTMFGLFDRMPLPTILIFGLSVGKSAMGLVLQKLTKQKRLPFDASVLSPLGLVVLEYCFKDAAALVCSSAWTLVIVMSIDLAIFHAHATSDLKHARGVSVFTMNKVQGRQSLESKGFYVSGRNVETVRSEWRDFAKDKTRLDGVYHV